MNDKIKDRARRLQETLDIPYAKAKIMAEGIESAARTQIVTGARDMPPTHPVSEKDLLLLHLLGPTWELEVYDMEQPYRTLCCAILESDEYTARYHRVHMDYVHGASSYVDSAELVMNIHPEGDPNQVARISTQGHPQQVADRINEALRRNVQGFRGMDVKMIADWS